MCSLALLLELEQAGLSVLQLLLPLIELAKQRGGVPSKLLAGTRLQYCELTTSVNWVSQAQLNQVISNAQKLKNQELSFVLGAHLSHNLSAYQQQLFLHANNINQLQRLFRLHQKNCLPFLFASATKAEQQVIYHWQFAIAEPSASLQRFYFEMFASMLSGFFKWRFPTLSAEIRFPFTQPSYFEQYQSHIHFDYSFGHHDFAFVINLNDFALTQNGALNVLVPRLRKRNAFQRVGFVQCIECMLRKDLRLSLDQLAQRMAVSPATLKRKLKQHNTSVVEIKDRILRQQAIVLLAQGQNNEHIAKALDFSDLSNFRRAFKRWTGVTPSLLKKAQLG